MPVVAVVQCSVCGRDTAEEAHFCHLCGAPLPSDPQSETRRMLVELPTSYAPIWRRFVGSFIDLALVTLTVAVVAIAFTWMMELVSPEIGLDANDSRFTSGMFAVVLWIVADWVYNARMISSPLGATIGKRFMGVRVTGLIGERLSFGQATGRHFAKFLSTFPALVGFMIAPLSRRRQALHDMVAGTIVLRRQ